MYLTFLFYLHHVFNIPVLLTYWTQHHFSTHILYLKPCSINILYQTPLFYWYLAYNILFYIMYLTSWLSRFGCPPTSASREVWWCPPKRWPLGNSGWRTRSCKKRTERGVNEDTELKKRTERNVNEDTEL